MSNVKIDDLSIDELKTKINDLYEQLRQLSYELMKLNIDQYDGKLSKSEVNDKLTALANKHIDLDSELHQCQRLLKQLEPNELENDKKM